MQENQTTLILKSLYQTVENFDDTQERITDILLKLDKLEEEKALYTQLDMPELFEQGLFAINMEFQSITLEKEMLEHRLDNIDLEGTLNQIELYESSTF